MAAVSRRNVIRPRQWPMMCARRGRFSLFSFYSLLLCVVAVVCYDRVCVCGLKRSSYFYYYFLKKKKNSFRFFKGRNSTTGWANISLNRTEPRRTWYFPLRLLSYDWIPKGLRQIEMIRKKTKMADKSKVIISLIYEHEMLLLAEQNTSTFTDSRSLCDGGSGHGEWATTYRSSPNWR